MTRDRTEKAVETLPGGKRLEAAAGLTDEEKGKARQEQKMPNDDKYVSREEEAYGIRLCMRQERRFI